MKKYLYIIIIALLGVIAWQEYHKGQIIEKHAQEIAELEDMHADACNDAINEILEQF